MGDGRIFLAKISAPLPLMKTYPMSLISVGSISLDSTFKTLYFTASCRCKLLSSAADSHRSTPCKQGPAYATYMHGYIQYINGAINYTIIEQIFPSPTPTRTRISARIGHHLHYRSKPEPLCSLCVYLKGQCLDIFENVSLKDQCLEIFDVGPLLRYLHRLGTNPILILMCMRSSRVVRASDRQRRSRNSPGFDPMASSEGRQMKQCRIQYTEKNIQKIPLLKKIMEAMSKRLQK